MKVHLYVRGEELDVVEKPGMSLGHEFMIVYKDCPVVATFRVTLVDNQSAIAEQIRLEHGNNTWHYDTVL